MWKSQIQQNLIYMESVCNDDDNDDDNDDEPTPKPLPKGKGWGEAVMS